MSIPPPKKKYATPEEKIFPHKHCSVCNKMVPEYSDGYCSAKCRGFEKRKEKRGKKKWVIWLIGGALIAVLLIVVLITLQP